MAPGLAGRGVLGVGAQRLRGLGAVAVDRQRLDAEPPRLGVRVGDVVDGRLVGHVDRLGDRAGQERLDRAHHLDVAEVRDRALADRDVEHRQVLGLEVRRLDDRVRGVDVRLDLRDLLARVAERLERERHRAVDDRHVAAADELLELHEREVRLDAGRVAVHEEGDRAGRREHRRLRVAVAVLLADRDSVLPRGARGLQQRCVLERGVRDRVGRVAVHPHDRVVRLAVLLVALVRAERRGDLRGLRVGAAGHERRDRRRRAATRVGVVRHAVGHEERAEVRVAQAELAERAGVDADVLGGVARRADDDLLREQDDVDGVLERVDVERAVRPAELHEVQRREVAGRVVDVHVLRARVGRVDAARRRRRVPLVDRRVVLHARIGAAPRGLGDLAHELARLHGLDRGAVDARR